MGIVKRYLRWYLVLILYIFGLKKASTRVDKTDRFTPQNSNNFATSLIPLTPPFKGFVRFIRYVTLHFVTLHFIRFALLCFTSFTSLRSVRRCLTPLASLIPFASLRSTHSVSLHSFRFTPLISLTSPYERCHSFHFVKFLHCFRFDSFHWNSAFRVVSHERDKCFWWRLNHLNLKFTSYNNITIQVSYLKYLLIKIFQLLSITV